jgi:hypothetical protein
MLLACVKLDNMSLIFFQKPALVMFFCLISIPCLAITRPPRKPINPKAAMEKIYSDQAKRANKLNREVKASSDLSPDEERELNSKKIPMKLSPEQASREESLADKDPEDQVEDDPDEKEDEDNEKALAGGGKPGAPAGSSDGKGKSGFSTPSSVPSTGRATAVSGQADSNLIQFPGKKPSKP